MKNIGVLLIFCGVVLGLYALTMDTSVEVNYPMGNNMGLPNRVNNIGLLSDKQNYLIFGGILSVTGLLLYFSKPKPSENIADENETCMSSN
jgi:uncharacterized membrane protein